MRAVAIVPFVLGLAAAIPTGNDDKDRPPADQVKIVDVNYGGSGCPKGSVTDILSKERDVVTLLFDKYVAQSGPGIEASKNRAACQLNIKIDLPQGYQVSVVQSDYRGSISLPEKVEASLKTTYYQSGDARTVSRSIDFKGKIDKDYVRTDYLGLESLVWSRCGAQSMLNIKSAIEIRPLGSQKHALMTVSSRYEFCRPFNFLTAALQVDSNDLKVTQIYHLRFRKCK
ncbi:uncharacterized protein CTRU02_201081 [Colletotrichum truncatum]|uniref:Secreted protein n=1 Tax=Colletotrichum truncatum TaxID=5467 RepID=A0ACC3ZGE5_COLTU|nr:uncharacterized protein CTRU02_12395 [Colletotrichum truncatum]KAF6784690.1 secreted protein [Colletotrichum truncatum]